MTTTPEMETTADASVGVTTTPEMETTADPCVLFAPACYSRGMCRHPRTKVRIDGFFSHFPGVHDPLNLFEARMSRRRPGARSSDNDGGDEDEDGDFDMQIDEVMAEFFYGGDDNTNGAFWQQHKSAASSRRPHDASLPQTDDRGAATSSFPHPGRPRLSVAPEPHANASPRNATAPSLLHHVRPHLSAASSAAALAPDAGGRFSAPPPPRDRPRPENASTRQDLPPPPPPHPNDRTRAPSRSASLAHTAGAPSRSASLAHTAGAPSRSAPLAHAAGAPSRSASLAHAAGAETSSVGAAAHTAANLMHGQRAANRGQPGPYLVREQAAANSTPGQAAINLMEAIDEDEDKSDHEEDDDDGIMSGTSDSETELDQLIRATEMAAAAAAPSRPASRPPAPRASAVPRRSALQIIEHLLKVRPAFADGWSATTTTTTGSEATATGVVVRRRDLPRRPPPVPHQPAPAPAPLPEVDVALESPLALVSRLSKAGDTDPLLLCFCTPELPGAYWTQAGPEADHDEVDLLTSSSIVSALHPLRIGAHLPLAADTAILVRNVDIYRFGEGAKLAPAQADWARCSVLMVPFLSGRDIGDQPTFILEAANAHGFRSIVVPVGRWARNEGNALDVAHRLVRSLETIAKQPPPSCPVRRVTIACPAVYGAWAVGVRSVLASAKARRDEEAKMARPPPPPPPRRSDPSRHQPPSQHRDRAAHHSHREPLSHRQPGRDRRPGQEPLHRPDRQPGALPRSVQAPDPGDASTPPSRSTHRALSILSLPGASAPPSRTSAVIGPSESARPHRASVRSEAPPRRRRPVVAPGPTESTMRAPRSVGAIPTAGRPPRAAPPPAHEERHAPSQDRQSATGANLTVTNLTGDGTGRAETRRPHSVNASATTATVGRANAAVEGVVAARDIRHGEARRRPHGTERHREHRRSRRDDDGTWVDSVWSSLGLHPQTDRRPSRRNHTHSHPSS